ncbi:hypothetical protein B0H66DRAFT_577922 [Apodospora peruviana]|uniref:Tyrosinase copper-binding domain-containing protein n=1 Tax=Apodospora peruviana TaxID=516989 RepID=A0AAE0M077_9PEZI|nr:hypothetical protein B0H66DRAFT_577922 [Apodospora peruviana]
MLFSLVSLLLATSSTGSTLAVSTPRTANGACTTKLQRRAWHTFSVEEKKAYVNADLCLMKLPATLGLNGTKNRFEELQAIHQVQSSITHGGAFLLYHRLLMHAHEQLIRNECGYTGAQPYWDEVRDAGNFSQSDVLDPVTGFGGNGVRPNGCIADGPFANYTNGLGPGYFLGDNCINRFVNDTTSLFASRRYIDECYEKKKFVEFWPCAEMNPHNGGHGGVGGKMLDPISSPGDPIFYLHHTWLDKVFWEWQVLDLPARLTDIGGRTIQGFPPGFGPGNGTGPPPFEWGGPPGGSSAWFPPPESFIPPAWLPPQIPQGNPGNETTLTHVLNMLGVIENARIADVMDIGGPLLCYEYV